MVRQVKPHTIVELRYELREGGIAGGLLERMDEKYPLKFYFGNGALLEGFEEALLGLREGETFSVTLPPEKAYGTLDSSNIKELNLRDLEDHPWIDRHTLHVGDRLSFEDHVSGRQKQGTITEVLPESILIDFNHAMAGKTLHFTGTILHIREPNSEERAQERYIESSSIRFTS